MTRILFWVLSLVLSPPEEREMSDRLAPPGFEGNYWGTAADKARAEGKLPPIVTTPHMARWDRWGRQVLRDGDIVFRMGDARLLHGYFPFSRFVANCSNSRFSHTGIIAIEKEGPVVYDMRHPAAARQPFRVWILDNVGCIGVNRLEPEFRGAIPAVLAYCRKAYQDQVPFDYELCLDDSALYCVEMTQKAFMAAGIELSKPIRLGDMERANEFSACMFGVKLASEYTLDHPLTFETLVYFPGNERHGLWSAKQLMTVVPLTYAPGYPDLSTGVMPTAQVPAESIEPRPEKVSNLTQAQQRTSEPQQRETARTAIPIP
jgi:Permuted papain-like amidase enzyme, YaeF/YiiX, C92 family